MSVGYRSFRQEVLQKNYGCKLEVFTEILSGRKEDAGRVRNYFPFIALPHPISPTNREKLIRETLFRDRN